MILDQIKNRALSIQTAGTIEKAVEKGKLDKFQDLSASEALVLGLLNQGVHKYIGILGHGNTDIANILSVYEASGLVKMYNVRSEVEAAHCASMLKWHYNETSAVLTSIGPGALHAFAGSLVSASNGLGVYHIYGDETTHDEGPNMQQIPKVEQASFLHLVQTMGKAYQLHTPESIFTALRRGSSTVFNPQFAGPFYFLFPMNIQPAIIHNCNLLEIPQKPSFPKVSVCAEDTFKKATKLVKSAQRITIKYGGGAEYCGQEILELASIIDAVIVSGAKMSGVVPYEEKRFMSVGGSKGSICGNYAMNNADLVIVIGQRSVCQWDCSGTAWKKANNIISFNSNPDHINHYNRSLLILGDARHNLQTWINNLKKNGVTEIKETSEWLKVNSAKKLEWEEYKKMRYSKPTLFSKEWRKEVLTQPAAIKIAYDFAKAHETARYFDAGDVQANGFQIVEDETWGKTFSDTGSSYMGFAVSSLLSNAISDSGIYTFAFSGDGSLTMNPQILFDGVQFGVIGCIIVFDNRRMAAITGLQEAQYKNDYKTSDTIEIDYVSLAKSVKGINALFGGYNPEDFNESLEEAYNYNGLSLIHLPVYSGNEPLGNLGVFGSWNVGNWCEEVQNEHHKIGF